jgi:glutamate/tyrosine decarboxylase-like PLP-dependent enzyme
VELNRIVPVDLSAEEFKKIGYELVDRIAEFIDKIDSMPVTRAEDEETVQKYLNAEDSMPEMGDNPHELIYNTMELLLNHSLFNGHPRFWGYVTSSPAPLGILGDFLSSAVNSNVGAWALSPMASEIEKQTIRWMGELIRYPVGGGLIVSGGNVANYIGFIASIRAKTNLEIRKKGIDIIEKPLRVYCSEETHTWIQKAADLFGLGTDSISWIKTDQHRRMDSMTLRDQIEQDTETGKKPFLVVGTAGSVSTGAIDPLQDIADICRQHGLWFHIDGAYGGFAASVPELSDDFFGLDNADSIAIDPHKWLYAPLEAGCILVKEPSCLTDAFSYHPPYYNFEEAAVNYVDYGIQNSRGFKALKVWLLLQQMGSKGYQQLIREDIQLAQFAFDLLSGLNCIETCTCKLSIATFRFIPPDLKEKKDNQDVKDYLNDLNRKILDRIERSGKFFLSNALVNDNFLLRMCIVNFRTNKTDIMDFTSFLSETGFEIDHEFRSEIL